MTPSHRSYRQVTAPRPAEDVAKRQRRQQLEVKAFRVLCTKCGALPGSPCETSSGERTARAHAVRIRLGASMEAT